MGFSKWIGATIGWSFGGPIGAIIGMALGSVLDSSTKGGTVYTQSQTATRSGDFEVSLLVLASIVIKADGKQDQRELDFVRAQFVQMYGKERANKAFRLFKEISKQPGEFNKSFEQAVTFFMVKLKLDWKSVFLLALVFSCKNEPKTRIRRVYG